MIVFLGVFLIWVIEDVFMGFVIMVGLLFLGFRDFVEFLLCIDCVLVFLLVMERVVSLVCCLMI